MKVISHINITVQKITDKLEDSLIVLGAMGVTWASEQLRINKSVVTSNLINSVSYSTSKEQSKTRGKTNGTPLSPALPLTVRIGSNVVYAARVELGFVGRDSLGRTFNQAPKSYLRASLLAHRGEIVKIIARSEHA